MNLVAPSPSRTMACASQIATSLIAACNALPALLSATFTSGRADLPVAISISASLVEVSPSTVMQLNERLAASLTIACSNGCAIAASVAM